ncbi:hypothetical protein CEXT_2711 [Caerostris extrusa]|uniref:Uncharacterized protein n=1 Tax=Caerostris extrusa TaxID=172846 RepID=A0AAV4NV76_CAEEX|nr:hypothetical protein CEXT_2711 [Caerostris extrusa]
MINGYTEGGTEDKVVKGLYCVGRIYHSNMAITRFNLKGRGADPAEQKKKRGWGCAVYRGSRAKGVGLCSRNLTGGRLSDGCAPPLRNRNSNPREGGHHSPIITYSSDYYTATLLRAPLSQQQTGSRK